MYPGALPHLQQNPRQPVTGEGANHTKLLILLAIRDLHPLEWHFSRIASELAKADFLASDEDADTATEFHPAYVPVMNRGEVILTRAFFSSDWYAPLTTEGKSRPQILIHEGGHLDVDSPAAGPNDILLDPIREFDPCKNHAAAGDPRVYWNADSYAYAAAWLKVMAVK